PVRPAVTTPQPGWRQRLTGRFFPSLGLSPFAAAFAAALLLVSVALGAWLVTARQQNRTLVVQLNQRRNEATENAELRTRIEELERRQSELSAQAAAQQAAGQE